MADDLKSFDPGVENSCNKNQSAVRQEGKTKNSVTLAILQVVIRSFICLFLASSSTEYPWQTELQITHDRRKINDILERRGAEIRNVYEQSQNSGTAFSTDELFQDRVSFLLFKSLLLSVNTFQRLFQWNHSFTNLVLLRERCF